MRRSAAPITYKHLSLFLLSSAAVKSFAKTEGGHPEGRHLRVFQLREDRDAGRWMPP
jgi:hypothetical protein